MIPRLQFRLWLFACAVALASGCATRPGDDAPPPPEATPLPLVAPAYPGTIFQAGASRMLFEDLKARRVGDLVTIRLVERTSASKSATTATSKSASADVQNATLFGRPVTDDGIPILSGGLDSDQSFEGSGDSSQSNQLEGTVTAVVVQTLPNGNLVIQGEKWLTLNQGREFIRVTGIVRPVDLEPDNSVSSEKIANARIAYSGRGALADANRMNWLTRFFQSPWLPF